MVTLLPVKTMTESPYKTAGKIALAGAATAFSFFSISKAISAYSNHYNKLALVEACDLLNVYVFIAIPIKEDEDSLSDFYNKLLAKIAYNDFFHIEDEWFREEDVLLDESEDKCCDGEDELLDEKHEDSLDHNVLSVIMNCFSRELELFCSARNKLAARIESHRGKEKFIEFCREGDSVIGDLNDSINNLIDLKDCISRYEIFFKTRMLLRDLLRRYKRHNSLCFSDPLAYARMHYADSLFPYSKLKEQLDNDWIALSKYAYDKSLNSSWSVVQKAQAYSKSLQAVSEVISCSQEYLLEKQEEQLHNQQKEKEVPLVA
jgi:hypothetical protein